MGMSIEWEKANCKTAGDEMFVQGADQHEAKRLCGGCPMKAACLAEALDNSIEYGVWGGMTERERRRILRHRPNVTSWKALFAQMERDARKAERAMQVVA